MKTKIFFIFIMLFNASVISAATIGDKEWRQLTDTTSLSYDQLASIYDTATGQLKPGMTSVGGVDFTGWTWASYTDVADMFHTLTSVTLSFNDGIQQLDPAWGTEFFSLFDPTYEDENELQAHGIVRDNTTPRYDFTVVGGFRIWHRPELGNFDVLSSGEITYSHIANSLNGFYLYKNASPVPVPAAIWLFVSGLAGIIGFSQQKKEA